MISAVNSIDTMMSRIDKLIENELFKEAYKEYDMVDNRIRTTQYIVSETNRNEREIVARFYSSYAYFLFSFSEYNQFFEMYIEAQKYGYSFDERRKFIYEAFVEPNINDFKLIYITNIKNMIDKGCISNTVEFEELPYWLITTGNKNEYYLYDKETDLIRDKFVLDVNDSKSTSVELTKSFSDYLIISNGNWSEVQSYVRENNYQGKKSYIATNNIEKLLSYFQGGVIDEKYLNKLVIFENMDDFKRYFINSNNYLPRNFIGNDEELTIYTNLIEDIHYHRLNKKTKSDDNVLISICIPSYNRGKRAYDNIIHTLKSELDVEIEVVLSNNGTKNDSREYYEKINQIKDPRLTYFEFEENQGFALNLCKAVDLAKGRYVLLLSDEDLVDFKQLKYVVSALDSYEDSISIVRTKSDGQGVVPFIGMAKSAKDSLFNFMLSSNYMSGIIFNKELLGKYHLTEYIKNNLDNEACLYYPHMVWELILCQYGNVWGSDIILVNEGHAETTDVPTLKVGKVEENTMPYYATFEGRLGQHKGFYNVIKDLEISKNDFDIFRELYKRLCGKTIFLMSLSIQVYYKQTDVNTDELLESAYNDSLKYLEEMYEGKKSRNKYKYEEDIKAIEGYYEYYKGQC